MEEAFLHGIKRGTKVRVKNEALKHIKIREWEYRGTEKGGVVLYDPDRGTLLVVKIEEVDWDYEKPKIED